MSKPVLKIYDANGVEIPIPAIVGKRGLTGLTGPNVVSTTTDSEITGLLKGAAGKVAQALPGTDYATPENISTHNTDAGAHAGLFGAFAPLRGEAIEEPDDFSWKDSPLHGKIYKTRDGQYLTDYDAGVNAGSGKTYYVLASGGLDSNDGLTPATPLQKIYTAYNKSDVSVIVLMGKRFQYNLGFNGTVIKKTITIRSFCNQSVILSAGISATLTKTSGKTNVYQITRSYIGAVIDTTRRVNKKEYVIFESVASVDLVDATPDSWYTSGGIVYVNCNGGANPSTNLALIPTNIITISTAFDSASNSLYIENVHILGAFHNEGLGTITFKNGLVQGNRYSDSGSNFRSYGSTSILQNVISAYADNDGFAYGAGNHIEIDCEAYSNGDGTETIDNGSTTHNGGKTIRFRGEYHGNNGPNVSDVSDATESLNINCLAYDSAVIDKASEQCADYQVRSGAAEMWLDGCCGRGSSFSAIVDDNAAMRIREGLYDYVFNSSATGTLEEY